MKVCRICKEDCSSKARVRDPEGNYYCKSCFEEQKAAGGAPSRAPARTPAAAAAPGVGAEDAGFSAMGQDAGLDVEPEGYGLADLLDDAGGAEEGSTMCPECGWAIRAGAALCVHCGYDPVKGKSLKTAVKGPERDPMEAEYAAKRARAASSAAMTPVRMIAGAAIAAVVCAAAWMGIVYSIGIELRYMAALVGAGVGVGAIKGARGDGGPIVGLTAAVVALAAIMGGRYGGVSLIMDDLISQIGKQDLGEEVVLAYLASDVADAWEAEGREIDWPLGLRPDEIEGPEDCPEDLWEETESRWAAMSPSAQVGYSNQVHGKLNDELRALAPEIKAAVFEEAFDFRFVALLGIGVVAAFAMGMWGDDLPV